MNRNNHDELARTAGYCCHLHRMEEIDTDAIWLQSRLDQMHCRHPNRAEVISWVERLGLLMVRVLHDDHSIYVVSLNFQSLHCDICDILECFDLWGRLLDLGHRAEMFEDIVDLEAFGITLITNGRLNDSLNWVIDDHI